MIQTIDAKERLVRLVKKDRVHNEFIFGAIPTYWCKSCDEITEFQLNWRKPFEPQEVEIEFNNAMGELKPWEQDYCNLFCRVCGQQVRCVYGVKEFAMSSYNFYPNVLFINLKAS
ncbi:hypothetical protein BM526_02535 [Alteromonas mediterranea]|uniref:hypothetical protein n=1 Tax=Alteromonas mediterranea TaxID=314275 RepID=UPI000903C5BA|nr:hypothetical protein [Alteromonas mediterranea]APE00833.1 hypothetical protein BM526_02535 [Alteromonas mediterranea]